jgi:hypothetical protein
VTAQDDSATTKTIKNIVPAAGRLGPFVPNKDQKQQVKQEKKDLIDQAIRKWRGYHPALEKGGLCSDWSKSR